VENASRPALLTCPRLAPYSPLLLQGERGRVRGASLCSFGIVVSSLNRHSDFGIPVSPSAFGLRPLRKRVRTCSLLPSLPFPRWKRALQDEDLSHIMIMDYMQRANSWRRKRRRRCSAPKPKATVGPEGDSQ
jgi:hypothetical protein